MTELCPMVLKKGLKNGIERLTRGPKVSSGERFG